MQALVPRSEYAALADTIYLNQASLGLIPVRSVEAMIEFLTGTAQHGNVRLSDDDEARLLDGLRDAGAALLGAAPRCVAVVGGASEALSDLAGIVAAEVGSGGAGSEVVLVATDFPSVTYPWLLAAQRDGLDLVVVDDLPDRNLTTAVTAAISERTVAVCASAVMYGTGSRLDCAAVAKAAHQAGAGARVIIDATQLAGAGPVSLADWGVDAVVTSGYKWLSSHGGVALLAVEPDLLAAVPPTVGWMGTDDPFDFRPMRLELAPDARRFHRSTIAYVSAVGLAESIAMLRQIGAGDIERHARLLAAALVNAVEPLGWVPFRPLHEPSASPHLIALRPTDPGLGAGVWAVQRMLRDRYRIVTSAREGALRVSLHVYNDASDVGALRDALADLA